MLQDYVSLWASLASRSSKSLAFTRQMSRVSSPLHSKVRSHSVTEFKRVRLVGDLPIDVWLDLDASPRSDLHGGRRTEWPTPQSYWATPIPSFGSGDVVTMYTRGDANYALIDRSAVEPILRAANLSRSPPSYAICLRLGVESYRE